MKTIPHTLTQITDVGIPHGNGVDSSLRIEKQYQRLGVNNPRIISAGHSPLHIAFAACAELSPNAIIKATQTLNKLNIKNNAPKLPVALNCAPRNSAKTLHDSREDYMYRVRLNNGQTYILYGRELLNWVLYFSDAKDAKVEKIISISDIIQDTSSGSQFRSAEFLPIVHVLAAAGKLDNYAQKESIKIKVKKDSPNQILIAPPDEYCNGRIIIDKKTYKKIARQKYIKIKQLTNAKIEIKKSLTDVSQGKLSVWPSSNHFSNHNLIVLNIGTRWKTNSTKTTDKNTIILCRKLNAMVGAQIKISV